MSNKFGFDGLAGGEVGNNFQRAIQEVLANIADPNTDPKKKREVNIKLIFVPDENRDLATVSIQTNAKLAPSVEAFTRIAIAKNNTDGKMIAKEFNAQKTVVTDVAAQLAEAPIDSKIFK